MNLRSEFLVYFFDKIKTCRYGVLKDIYSNLFELPEGADIDLVADKADLNRILSVIGRGKGISRIKNEKKSFATFVKIYFQDGGYLEIDLIHRFDRKGIIYKSITEVLGSCEVNSQGIKIVALHHQFDYIILFYMLNKADVPGRYRVFFSSMSKPARSIIFAYITGKYDVHINTLDELYEYHNRHRKKLLKRIFSDKKNRYSSYLIHRLQYFFDTATSALKDKSITITFTGVDGAGKSTILESVRRELETKYRQPVKVLRHRPSLLPILSSIKYGKAQAEQKAAHSLPRQGVNDSFISSLIRFGYYYTDYLIGRAFVYFRYTSRGVIVLYDRYYFDFIVDGKRSNISLKPGLIRLGYRLVSKPEVNFFLYAPVDEILRRKQELNEGDIRTMTDDYMRLFGDLSKKYKGQMYITLSNDDLKRTTDVVMNHIISAQINI